MVYCKSLCCLVLDGGCNPHTVCAEDFRFLTLVMNGGQVNNTRVLCVINFVWQSLRAYERYFYALDEGAEGVDLLIKGGVFIKWGSVVSDGVRSMAC